MSFLRNLYCLLAVLCLTAVSAQSAQANYVIWTDPETQTTMSYPDTWMRLNNQLPGDKLTIAAPTETDMARCKVHVREDKRFLYYPLRYRDAVQKVAYAKDFWREIFASYRNVQVHRYLDGAGIGRGIGSYVLITYDEAWPKSDTDLAGIMLVSLYHDDAYIATCSAKKDGFNRWRAYFGSILSSIEFKKIHHELTTGEYRDFISDIEMVFEREDGLNTVKY